MKDGEGKRRWGAVMDIEKGRKYVHHYRQKKVEEHNAVIKQSAKSNHQKNDTSTVAKELSSNRFLVQLWHGDSQNNINNSAVNYDYRRFAHPQERIIEEEEDIFVSDECSDEEKGDHGPETELTYSNSDNSLGNHNIEKSLYKSSTKMDSSSNNVTNISRAHPHSKTHHHSHNHNSRRSHVDDETIQGPTSMITVSQHHLPPNDEENAHRTREQDEQQLYSLQSHYGHGSNNDGHSHRRHGGHKHRSNSHVHGERKHIRKNNYSENSANISDPERNVVGVANSAANNNNNIDVNYKASNNINGVFSLNGNKQGNHHQTNTSGNNSFHHHQQPPQATTYKSSKPTTMAELNAKRSKCN